MQWVVEILYCQKNIPNFIELGIYEKFIEVARKMHILKNVTKLTA